MDKPLPVPQDGERMLFVRFSSLGDVVLAMKEAKALKDRFPGIELWWLCCDEYSELVTSQPYVDGVVGWDRSEGRMSVFKLIDRIKGMKFRWLFSCQDNDRTALVSLLSRIPFRIGGHRLFGFAFHASQEEAWEVWGGKTRPAKSLYGDPKRSEALRSILGDRRVVMCILGTSKPYKNWLVDHWILMLSKLPHGLTAVLTGSGPEETRMANLVEEAVGPQRVINLADRLDLMDLIALSEMSSCAVGGDTGPLHMAREAGIPCVGLFAIKDPAQCSHEGPNLTSVISPLAVDDYEPLKVDPDQQRVMRAIDPDVVLSLTVKAALRE
ncbi:MAG: glycosyltransferase family 9 protein [Thermanaerothrix sp.]|nr:glycosyltransferase family 9 protein [Thermanaerothrix sp.]